MNILPRVKLLVIVTMRRSEPVECSTILILFRDFDYEHHEAKFLDRNKDILAKLAPPRRNTPRPLRFS